MFKSLLTLATTLALLVPGISWSGSTTSSVYSGGGAGETSQTGSVVHPAVTASEDFAVGGTNNNPNDPNQAEIYLSASGDLYLNKAGAGINTTPAAATGELLQLEEMGNATGANTWTLDMGTTDLTSSVNCVIQPDGSLLAACPIFSDVLEEAGTLQPTHVSDAKTASLSGYVFAYADRGQDGNQWPATSICGGVTGGEGLCIISRYVPFEKGFVNSEAVHPLYLSPTYPANPGSPPGTDTGGLGAAIGPIWQPFDLSNIGTGSAIPYTFSNTTPAASGDPTQIQLTNTTSTSRDYLVTLTVTNTTASSGHCRAAVWENGLTELIANVSSNGSGTTPQVGAATITVPANTTDVLQVWIDSGGGVSIQMPECTWMLGGTTTASGGANFNATLGDMVNRTLDGTIHLSIVQTWVP